ncbi:hypothetical protein EON65_48930 [archaeon]|nr:MAG: hypothetical protein EON65_48930 [archaeon]
MVETASLCRVGLSLAPPYHSPYRYPPRSTPSPSPADNKIGFASSIVHQARKLANYKGTAKTIIRCQ